ncbi:MAG: hypothetical protein ACREMB_05490 [Candidatus Rokuibacteriota bacterium]
MIRALILATLLALAPAAPGGAQEGHEADPGLLAPGGYVIFLDATGPLSYATMTPRDVPPGAIRIGRVTGRGCQFGVAVPVTGSVSGTRVSGGGGVGGFARAVRDIQERHPGLRGIYDVMIDVHALNILTFFRRLCTEVTALGFR